MENYKAIDYDHLQGGLPCNAVLSDMDGKFEAGWTFDRNDETVTEEHALTEKAFGLLWDGIAASVSGGGIFWACLVTDTARLIDPALHHVIATVQVRDGCVRHRTFMVPSGEADPVFTAWLEALAVPGGPRRQDHTDDAAQPVATEGELRRERVLA